MKNTIRIVLSTLAALTVMSGAAMPASAAQARDLDTANIKVFCSQNLQSCVQNQSVCRDWIFDLICNWKPTLPEENPDAENPVIPEETPDVEIPEETPDVPTQKPEQPETSPEVPETDNNVSPSVHAYEKAVVELVNKQRAANGLAPLALSEELCVKARIKSQDMADNNYFSHNSPTYGSPFNMMQNLGITYKSAGENIAMGYSSPEAVVTAWMNSQGHRENILSSKYTTLGVGYVADGNYWTQWFIG